MGRGVIVQVERLRDQVYRLIREDLRSGALEPGRRILECELAERYNVSRTPVREALFQLGRDGLVEASGERGYVVAVDTPLTTTYRQEVRNLLDPQLAFLAAAEGTPAQRRSLVKALERQVAAHAAGKPQAFVRASREFRAVLRSMCPNHLLTKCLEIIDDQAECARRAAGADAACRRQEIEANSRLAAAVAAGDAERARRAMADQVRQAPREQAELRAS